MLHFLFYVRAFNICSAPRHSCKCLELAAQALWSTLLLHIPIGDVAVMAEEPIVPRQLFGGAMSLAMPDRFDDISEHRQVPDNQEVFGDPTQDQSIILEVVEHQPGVANAAAAEYFFQDLAALSQAASMAVTSSSTLRPDQVPGVPVDAFRGLAAGELAMSKGRGGALNKVHVMVLAVRLPQYASDVLLTLNTPIFISEGSAAAEHAGAGYKADWAAAPDLFQRMAASLQIVDFGLFGASV